MINYRYKNIRKTSSDENAKIMDALRPSAGLRFLRGIAQYSIFQTAFTYGIIYNGFGFHSYYLQKTQSPYKYSSLARTKTILTVFTKFAIISIPFYCFKQLFFWATDRSLQVYPQAKFIQKSYIQNILGMTLTIPLFYLFERNLIKSFRGSLVLCLFSLANDVFIEYKRNKMLLNGYTKQYIKQQAMIRNIQRFKQQITIPNDPDIKTANMIQRIDWQNFKKRFIQQQNYSRGISPEKLTEQQLKHFTQQIHQEFKGFSSIFK